MKTLVAVAYALCALPLLALHQRVQRLLSHIQGGGMTKAGMLSFETQQGENNEEST
jgi:hypothetical protein